MKYICDESPSFTILYRWTFIIAAIFGVIGILLTYIFVPDMTGVDFAVEDEQFIKYLGENGWVGEISEATDSLASEETGSKASKDEGL